VRAAKSGAPAAATSAPAGLKGEDTVIELTTTRATIARRMGEAAAIPVFSASIDVDLSAIADLRRSGGVEVVPSINDFVVKAAALTLRELPHFNASFVDGRIVRHSRVNVGIAVATDEALLVPAVVDADRRSLAEITSESRRLSQAARDRRLQPDDLAAGTFTVSNLGMFGVTTFTAVLNVPQVAILAVGAAVRRPVESPDGVVFRDVATLTLTGDHRAVYGADAARFLAHLRDLLEHPLALVL
jgi:pyruvate dehydrogenase E2 component (dihydrolipoyllysine-residue acetyltransferase)